MLFSFIFQNLLQILTLAKLTLDDHKSITHLLFQFVLSDLIITCYQHLTLSQQRITHILLILIPQLLFKSFYPVIFVVIEI